ncbi:MAG: hypothetical protein F6K31_28335 [Symploca sp. SIO2G7]|nr:hypothetical protein [Symploca sp. SIO2G7]
MSAEWIKYALAKPQVVRAAKAWVVFTLSVDENDVDLYTDKQIICAVHRYYEGGVGQFIIDKKR